MNERHEADPPLRILMLLRDLDTGGAQRQAALLARALAARGHEVTLATLYPGGALAGDLAGAGVRVETLDKKGRFDVVGFGARYFALLRRTRPDVIYAFLTVQNLLSLAGRFTDQRPLIVWGVRASAMDMAAYDGLSRQTHAWEARLASSADLVIANAEVGAADAVARGFPAERVRVVTNAVDTARFAPDDRKRAQARAAWGVADSAVVIGHAARFDPMKDHDTFFAAMRAVCAGRPEAVAVCVAPAEADRAALRRRAEALGLKNVIVTDDGADIAAAFNGFDVFCSSSAYGEGYSNVLAEAMACGLPCVATRVGDAPALIGDAALLAPPRDPEALAAALLEAVARRARDPESEHVRARTRVSQRTPEAAAIATEAAFRAALPARR